MATLTSIQGFWSIFLTIGVGITALLFTQSAGAQIPLIDRVEIEHTETATFALG